MPIRLDYALWGISLVITLCMRGNLLVSTDKKYLGMKYTTWLIDYMYLGANLYFIELFLSKNWTAQNVFFHHLANSCFIVVIDVLKCVLFSRLLPKVKVDSIKNYGKQLLKSLFTFNGIKGNFLFFLQATKGRGYYQRMERWQDYCQKGCPLHYLVLYQDWGKCTVHPVELQLCRSLMYTDNLLCLYTCIFILIINRWFQSQPPSRLMSS